MRSDLPQMVSQRSPDKLLPDFVQLPNLSQDRGDKGAGSYHGMTEAMRTDMKKRVLLVDDDFAVLAGMAGVLVSEGYNVIHAADGVEAVEKFRNEGVFDIVLLDLNMPRKSGWDAFEQITAIDPLIPIIVITARPDQYATAVAAGVGALMEKPLDLPILLQKMAGLIQESARERLARKSGRSPNLSYCPAPKQFEGEIFGQVVNRARAKRRPWDRSAVVENADPGKGDQPLDRLLKAWTDCTEEERQLFFDGIKRLVAPFGKSSTSDSNNLEIRNDTKPAMEQERLALEKQNGLSVS